MENFKKIVRVGSEILALQIYLHTYISDRQLTTISRNVFRLIKSTNLLTYTASKIMIVLNGIF